MSAGDSSNARSASANYGLIAVHTTGIMFIFFFWSYPRPAVNFLLVFHCIRFIQCFHYRDTVAKLNLPSRVSLPY